MHKQANALDLRGLCGRGPGMWASVVEGSFLVCAICRLLKATHGRRPFLSPLPWDLGTSGVASGLSHVSLLSFGVGTLALMTGTFTSPRWPQLSPPGGRCLARAHGTVSALSKALYGHGCRRPLGKRPDVQGLPGNLTSSFLPPTALPPAPDGQSRAFTQLGGGWQAAAAPGQLGLALW